MDQAKLTNKKLEGSIRRAIDNGSTNPMKVIVQTKDGLKEDRVIELRGFGTFEIRTRKGREKARNPKTGDLVSVETHGVAIFRPGKELKDAVWNLRDSSSKDFE